MDEMLPIALQQRAIIGQEQAQEAQGILRKYRNGKSVLDDRIRSEERWYRLRHWEEMGPSADPNVTRPTSAWLLNTLMSKHADAMDNYPSPNVLPRERSDEQYAKQLSDVLPCVLERSGFDKSYSDAWWDKLKNGTAAYGIFWDSELENGLGDIVVRQIDMLNLYWQPGVRDIQESANLFITAMIDNDALDAQYPDRHLRSPVGEQQRYDNDDNIELSDKSIVVDWYYKRRNENGKTVLHYAKLVGDQVLYSTENAGLDSLYAHGLYPVVLDVCFPMKDSPAGFGYVSVCKDPQSYIDKLDGYILDHAAQLAHPRWYVSQTAGVNDEEYLDRGNELVHVAGAIDDSKLQQITVPAMGSAPITALEMKINEMKETSANRDFSNGSTGSGVTAASAIYALQESGNKVSRDAISAAYRCYTDMCKQVLELIGQFYTAPRYFRITQPNGKFDFVAVDNSVLMGAVTGIGMDGKPLVRKPIFDIKITAQKKNPFSTASANELAMTLYSAGFFNPQLADQSLAALEMMTFEGKDKLMERLQQNGSMMQMIMQMQGTMQQMAGMLGLQEPEEKGSGQKQAEPKKGTVNGQAANAQNRAESAKQEAQKKMGGVNG